MTSKTMLFIAILLFAWHCSIHADATADDFVVKGLVVDSVSGEGEPYAAALLSGAPPAGIYEAKLVVESVAPMSFVLN